MYRVSVQPLSIKAMKKLVNLFSPAVLIGRILIVFENTLNRIKARAVLSKFKSVGKDNYLQWPVKIDNPRYMTLGNNVKISWHGWLLCIESYGDRFFEPQIIIHDNAYIGNACHIVACRKVEVGKSVMLADKCYLSDNLHAYEDVTLPIIHNPMKVPGEIVIGDHSWLGENVCVFGDVKIGKHCVVGAGSVVMESIPDYSVAVGSPARIIKRYNPETQTWQKTDKDGNFLAKVI
jgi:acetyltransferase-like isoleucine patch superfamily enzyme